jgi:hypothetical protein
MAWGKMAENHYSGGTGFEKDVHKGFEYAKLAAVRGDCDGQFRLGCTYFMVKVLRKAFW